MTALWVCEKYSVAADLARVLFGGIASHSSPVIETKKGVRLVYTSGHAVEPAAPEVYDAAYNSWEYQDVTALVRNGFRLVAAAGKAGAVATIEKEIRKAGELIVATDAGREGEMIAWEIIERAGSRAPVRRFWASALTDNALKKAAADLLPAERKLPLYHAGRARSRADWIEGLTYYALFQPHPHRPTREALERRAGTIRCHGADRGSVPGNRGFRAADLLRSCGRAGHQQGRPALGVSTPGRSPA